jgi:hypothetical protein
MSDLRAPSAGRIAPCADWRIGSPRGIRLLFLSLLAVVGEVATSAISPSPPLVLAWWSESCGGASIQSASGLRLHASVGQHDAVSVVAGRYGLEGGFLTWGPGGLTSTYCLGDFNEDGSVDGLDLGVMLASWGAINRSDRADLNSDGHVNGLDVALLLAAWGDCPLS